VLTSHERGSPCARVLIVDESADGREVLRTVLRQRGVSTMEASGARQGLDLMRQFCPDVVVLDMEGKVSEDEGLRDEFTAHSRAHDAAIIVLGVARAGTGNPPGGRVIPKPYHYAPLIRTIEQLLGR
jgi:CheY-like chemotaxis protein